jgi:uncharacterized protein (DUF1778 family)
MGTRSAIEIRLKADDKAAIRAAAERTNPTVSEWVRLTLPIAAQAKPVPK